MKILGLMITSFLFWNVCTSEIVTRTFRWTNVNDLYAAHWQHGSIRPDEWESPLDLDSKLVNLNSNFTDKVWGWRTSTNSSNAIVQLYWDRLPEYCGIINATLEVKLYFSANHTSSFMWPAVGPSFHLYFVPTPLVEWQTVSSELNISYANRFLIQHYATVGELFIFDEIRLTYSAEQNDDNCPSSCNHDCEYRAIDCHYYYTCVDRKYKKIHSCSKEEGLAFNPSTKTCDLLENVGGCNTSPEICVCAYKPHETNCSSYYFCNNTCHPEECEERHCPSGLLWSTDALGDESSLQQCVLPANATCQSEEGSETTTGAAQLVVLPQVRNTEGDNGKQRRHNDYSA